MCSITTFCKPLPFPSNVNFSKQVARLLRHRAFPKNAQGFANLATTLATAEKDLHSNRPLSDLQREWDIIMTKQNEPHEKERFEVRTHDGNKIVRAYQGHSADAQVNLDSMYTRVPKGTVLKAFHGTQSKLKHTITKEGLKAMTDVSA